MGTFVAISFAVSWLIWSPIVLPSRVSGFSAWLFYYAGVIGPTVAAVVCSRFGEREDRKTLWDRIARVRAPLRWYLTAFSLPFLVRGAALILLACTEGSLPLVFRSSKEILSVFLIVVFLVPFEEIGWRGHLLPALQRAHSPLVSSLVVAFVWALWHAPLVWARVGYQRSARPWAYLLLFAISIVPISCLTTWLYNETSESVPIAALFHAAINMADFLVVLPARSGEVALWITTAILTVIVIGVWSTDRSLGTKTAAVK